MGGDERGGEWLRCMVALYGCASMGACYLVRIQVDV